VRERRGWWWGNVLHAKRDDPVTLHLYDRVISAHINRTSKWKRPIRSESDHIIDILCVLYHAFINTRRARLYRAERQNFVVYRLSVTAVRYCERFKTQFGGQCWW